MFETLRKKITKTHKELSELTVKQLISERMQKYCDMGVYQE
jgi:acetyl-CoA carboxylase alpha subunit